jgi:UDP-N-acetylglucosamine:LPS N-acetylglucosamine transferase
VDELLADRPRLDSMSTAMRSMARPEAAEEIAEELIALASCSWRGSPGPGPEGTV